MPRVPRRFVPTSADAGGSGRRQMLYAGAVPLMTIPSRRQRSSKGKKHGIPRFVGIAGIGGGRVGDREYLSKRRRYGQEGVVDRAGHSSARRRAHSLVFPGPTHRQGVTKRTRRSSSAAFAGA